MAERERAGKELNWPVTNLGEISHVSVYVHWGRLNEFPAMFDFIIWS